ncbi:hypothetical protein FNU76_02220 [Chitinimonas arctica]|uniref:Uncharacterized protein n=1 Tax=Chitinimonas arctica TaxID=2594795 RepID=A0A516SAT9_9NEIS|nr:hypothetical protein [Chitinimonas arctica]QDQ25260.1 hypothetical protein FNU76_02220 [Chitinimonas arctica]
MDTRDPLTQQYFNGKIKLLTTEQYELNGIALDATTVGKLVGALDDSLILVEESNDDLVFIASHPFLQIDQQRRLTQVEDGIILISNDLFALHPIHRGKGLGNRSESCATVS